MYLQIRCKPHKCVATVYYYIFYIEVSPVLKNNFTRLYQSLPQDINATIYKLMQMVSHKMLQLPNGVLDHVRKFQSIQKINETIICILMAKTRMDTTGLEFCDILETLIESENSRNTVHIIRNGMLYSDTNICLFSGISGHYRNNLTSFMFISQ